jgi:HAD superfamily hydrolase (TIGR01509 family)
MRALIFDLDGTLVLTEPFKALSHARCIVQLSSDHLTEAEVIEATRDLTGIPHPETLQVLARRFHVEDAARQRAQETGFADALQYLITLDLKTYAALIADAETLRRVQSRPMVDLLRWAHRQGFKTGLATMAPCEQVGYVLDALGLRDELDCVATLEVVQRGKPDPEIFLYVARELQVAPDECLVFEDTTAGVQGALAAGMQCIAVPNTLTVGSFDGSTLLDKRWVVRDTTELKSVVQRMLASTGNRQP